MIVVFAQPVLDRLAEREAVEGIPPIEVVREAVEVYSHLTASERRTLGFVALQIVVGRART